MARRVIICGAAGRDFHNFNVAYRHAEDVDVVAFTATQIPDIDGRRYPPELAGSRYPDGIEIHDQSSLEALIEQSEADAVVFAYSDVRHKEAMHLASRALAAGVDFEILGPQSTYLDAPRPVVAVSAVRTGCGKSQIARHLAVGLGAERRVVAIRHAMPYGDLAAQAVQRFATAQDLDAADCTLEEREEYEPHIEAGVVVFAGVDYAGILEAASAEADLIVWDGGNNDYPFVRPDVHVVVVDALRPGHVTTHFPGEAVLRMADIVVINKVDAASPGQVDEARRRIAGVRSDVPVVLADSPVTLEDEASITGKRILIVEDGPTLTHGDMAYGAGYAAVHDLDVEIVDPRPHAVGSIATTYERYGHIGAVLPAMGYSAAQRNDLAATIRASGAEAVVAGTPIDLARDAEIDVPTYRVRYRHHDHGLPKLIGLVRARL